MWLTAELHDQLALGLPGPHSERELRVAWERFGGELMAEQREPSARPWSWWRFMAGRPPHLLAEPPFVGADPEQVARARDESTAEPLLFLVDGYLRDDEREALLARAREAQARVGTDRQLGELRITGSGERVALAVTVRRWQLGRRSRVGVRGERPPAGANAGARPGTTCGKR